MSDELNQQPNAQPPQSEPSPAEADAGTEKRNAASEAEAIAAAMMIGERMRREDKASYYHYGKRLGLGFAGVCALGLVFLFLYTLVRKDFSPMVGATLLTLGMLGGMGFWYWATTRANDGG